MNLSKEETEQHLFKLAKALIDAVGTDNNFGTPSIDAKRPFGNSSPELDVPEIIGLKPESEDGHTTEQYEYCSDLLYDKVTPFIHKRCELVLKSTL